MRTGHLDFGRFLLLALLTSGAAVTTACGPVEYVSQVSTGAAREVAAAKSAGADRYAPYDYTMAVEYLHKAKEEAGHSDFQASTRFGKLSEQHAREARRIALENAGRTEEPK